MFEPNVGQTDDRVKFLAHGHGFDVFLTNEGATLRVAAPGQSLPARRSDGQPDNDAARVLSSPAVLRLQLIGARSDPRVEGTDQLPGKSHYFRGRDPSKWRTGVARFARVKYADVYPGVDVVFYGQRGSLEYDFLIARGQDPSVIRLHVDGADDQRVDADGNLVIRVGTTEIRQLRPVVYQYWDGERHDLEARYIRRGADEIGVDVSGYRPDAAIVVDPVLTYSSFLGGSDVDAAHSVAVDGNDKVYLTGQSASLDFPTTNPEQPENRGGFDAVVTKVDRDGGVIFSTYLGGSGQENDFRGGVEAAGIVVDAAGNVSVTGRTSSIDFPVVNALFPSYRGGDYDAFVATLSPDGTQLLYSTYLGGGASDSGNGIAVDQSGHLYVVGGTRSDTDFPISAGAFQAFLGGQLDGFLTKIDPTQQGAASLIYSTYLGGVGIDRATAVAVDPAGRAYLTGRTESVDFPIRSALQPTYAGGADAFVTVIGADGAELIYSTYLGGRDLDLGNGIAVDASGNVAIAGETTSTDFPVVNGFQVVNGGGSDAFVSQIDTSGLVLLHSTYLGGSGLDRASGIAVDAAGRISLTGETSSPDFPTANAFQGALGGGRDAFAARLDPARQGVDSLLFSSFLGGERADVGSAIALGSAGDAWIVGQTASALAFPAVNPMQPVYGGGPSDAFLAHVAEATVPDYTVAVTPSSVTVAPGSVASYTTIVTPIAGFTGTVDLSVSGLPASATASFDPSSVVIADGAAQNSLLAVSTAPSTPPGAFPLTIIATSGAGEHRATASLVVAGAEGSSDASMTMSGSSNPIEVGRNLSYTLRVVNLGPDAATGIQVTDTLPAVTFVSATATRGTCSGLSTIRCDIGSLAAGESATVTIVVTPQAVGLITNSSSVSADQNDPDPNNNVASVETAVTVGCSEPGPCVLDPNLVVSTTVSGLIEPTGVAFLGPDDFLVIERSTGQVKRVTDGVVQGIALDLAVNSASERGLLGIALHPNFVSNGYVYLYWTCRGAPQADECDSPAAGDTSDIAQVPLLGNRVDRFVWDGATLTFDQNVIRLRAYQQDADESGTFNQPLRGNHNGGKIAFGPDGSLYILIGDNGRRGWLQNISEGVLPDGRDDQFGGPEPDAAHLTGVILRLNDDGSTPADNPFFEAGAQLGGEAGSNIQKVFAYGVRNSFGLAFDPITGVLWTEENGDDSYDEINRVVAGSNNGWVQAMGPLTRVSDYKAIETSSRYFGLQQVRWPPTRIADTPEEAAARLFMLPGAIVNDPQFSWRFAVAPSPIGFLIGEGLGPAYNGDLFVGAARTTLSGGYLFRFKLTADRSALDLEADPRLADQVADNVDKFDLTESESLLIGRDFGITSDIQTTPRGTLCVVSLSNGAIYEIRVAGSMVAR